MENNKVQKILHLRSTGLNEDNSPKLPEVNDIQHGEIAMNYHKGVETIAIKNDDNEIATFKSDKYYKEEYASKEYVQQRFFVGTPEEYSIAYANGQIAVGALVILLNDELNEDNGGGNEGDNNEGDNGGNDNNSDATSSILGKGVLGQMVLGKKRN